MILADLYDGHVGNREEDMSALEKATESLRPLVESKTWDYSVVWSLRQDPPSRFIEWMGCCCSGGYTENHTVIKEERSEGDYQFTPNCRDTHSQHSVRTRACEALAVFPSTIPLYSGIHGEVVVSSQPRWLTQAIASDSNSSHELIGTRVLIPVGVGLIELFAAKQIPKDHEIIDYVKARFSVVEEHESKTKLKSLAFHPLTKPNALPSAVQPRSRPSFRSSCSSNPSEDHSLIDLGSTEVSERVSDLSLSFGKLPVNQRPICRGTSNTNKKGVHRSKNLVSERNRRNRIRGAILTLRSLVPKISKMDRISTLGDAIDYIAELQEEVKKLEAELWELEEEEFNGADKGTGHLPATHENVYSSSDGGEKKPLEAHVEVHQIGVSCLLLKIYAEHRRGGFTRLMKAMEHVGFEVVDASVTTFHGNVFHMFQVEVRSKEMHREEGLRESLIRLTDLIKLGHA